MPEITSDDYFSVPNSVCCLSTSIKTFRRSSSVSATFPVPFPVPARPSAGRAKG